MLLRRPYSRLAWLVILVAWPALACAGLPVDPAPAPASERPAGVVPYPAQAAEATAPFLAEGLRSPGTAIDDTNDFYSIDRITESWAGLRSYRAQVQVRFTSTTGGTDQWLAAETVYVDQPAARSVTIRFGDSAGNVAVDTVALVQIGNHFFTAVPGFGCVSGAESGSFADHPFAELTTPDTFLQGLSHARRILPDEMIHGTPVRHYTFDQQSLQEPPGQFTSLEGHIYVAQEGGHVVRLTMVADGREISALGQSDEGRFTMEVNVFNINEAVAVIAPVECSQTTIAPYPVLPEATDITVLPDLFSYRSRHSFADAVNFYLGEMTAAGWTVLDEEFALERLALLHFQKNGMSVTVNISEESGSGMIAVLILREP
jgi:hypothetical protein